MCTRIAFQVACKSAKKAYFMYKLEDMVKYRKPWLGTCWIKDWPIPKVPQIQLAQGHTINELQPMFDAFQSQFQPTVVHNINTLHPFLQSLPEKPSQPFVAFSPAELCEALATCLSSSALGPSHMSWSLLKMFLADDVFWLQFLQLANDIITSSIWPTDFKDSVTVVIPKPHKDDHTQVKNFWPITLLECAGKLVSKLIAARLQSDAVHFNLVHPLQFSGLKYWSTVDTGFFLTEYITKACNAGHSSLALALDVSQFFPSLHCNIILLIMCKLGFAPELCQLFSSYYDSRSTKYLWNIFFSKDHDTNNGVPQGDPLSPCYISVLFSKPYSLPPAMVYLASALSTILF